MNFLGHAIFADGPPDVVFGSMMADFFKRRAEERPLSQEITDGMSLHRSLDRIFGNVESLAPCRTDLASLARQYYDPIIDIFADHVIASRWEDLFDDNVYDYVSQLHHEVLMPRIHLLPERGQFFVRQMIGNDILSSYKSKHGYQLALERLAERAKKGYLISDNLDMIMKISFNMESVVIGVIPRIKDITSQEMQLHGYSSEGRLRWREFSNGEHFDLRSGGERK